MIELADASVPRNTVEVSGRRFAVGAVAIVLVLFVGACRGSSDPVAAPTTVAQATPTAEVVETPTEAPTAVPAELSDEQRVNAAIAAFDAESQPAELIAYDHLETTLDGTFVNVDVCGWTGDTVFDDVHRSTYRTFVNDDGEAEALFVSTAQQSGECQNSELIESALQFTRDYDPYWTSVQVDPASFDAEAAGILMVRELVLVQEQIAADWLRGDLSFQNGYFDGALPTSSVTDVLVRSYTQEGFDVFELISCRDIPIGYGLYREEVLIDDFRDGLSGPHGVSRYLLTREDGLWKTLGVRGDIWFDCFGFEEGWLDGVNASIPEAGIWEGIDK